VAGNFPLEWGTLYFDQSAWKRWQNRRSNLSLWGDQTPHCEALDRLGSNQNERTRFTLNMLPLIIGLEDRYRGRELEAQLLTQGLHAERVAGVWLSELTGPEDVYADQATARVLLRRNLTEEEIGCSLAHRAAYQLLLTSDSSFGLIFEDDARLQSALQLG